MTKMIIDGGVPLKGTVTPVANKNTILKLLPACLLTDDTVTIHNVPMNTDVKYLCQIIEKLGGTIEKQNNDTTLVVNCSKLHSYVLDADLSDKMKASVLLLGPLLVRFGKGEMPTPQGCKLGTRPLDAIIENMISLGAIYTHEHGTYRVETKGLQPKEVWQWFPSVTGTEILLMMAARIPGKTTIYNAACEPHTQELCHFLVAMWAKITGIWSNKIEVEGVEKLRGTEWTVDSDHLDVGGFIAAAVMTEGELTIQRAVTKHMSMILQVFEKIGVRVEVDTIKDEIFVPKQELGEMKKTVKGDFFEIQALPWPLYPADLIHVAVVLALKAKGSMMFRNSFYEYSFFFVQELAKMKAVAVLADPTKIVTFGWTKFKAAKMVCPDIIQASYALIIAAFSAHGKSELLECDSVFRRYPNLVEQFSKLGGRVEIV